MYTLTSFSVSSPTQCLSQAVVCISTPRMYPQSRHFLVTLTITFKLYTRFKESKFNTPFLESGVDIKLDPIQTSTYAI